MSVNNLQALADEIKNDPISRNYSAMGDEEVAKTFTIVDREANRDIISSAMIMAAIVREEFSLLKDTDRQYLQLLLTIPNVPLSNLLKSELISLFGDSQTTNNLVAILKRQGTRTDELGLGGPVTPSDVADARRLAKG